jgi:hypothetical protein
VAEGAAAAEHIQDLVVDAEDDVVDPAVRLWV